MTNIPGDNAFQYKPPSDPAVATDPKAIPVPTGYRKMSPAEFALFEEITAHANATGFLAQKVASTLHGPGEAARCHALARSHLQTGYMWLKRAVAQPDNF